MVAVLSIVAGAFVYTTPRTWPVQFDMSSAQGVSTPLFGGTSPVSEGVYGGSLSIYVKVLLWFCEGRSNVVCTDILLLRFYVLGVTLMWNLVTIGAASVL